jgi:hypothetical protein
MLHPETVMGLFIYLNSAYLVFTSGQSKPCSHDPVEGSGRQPADMSGRV